MHISIRDLQLKFLTFNSSGPTHRWQHRHGRRWGPGLEIFGQKTSKTLQWNEKKWGEFFGPFFCSLDFVAHCKIHVWYVPYIFTYIFLTTKNSTIDGSPGHLPTCQVIDRATMVKTKGWGLTKVPISPISVAGKFCDSPGPGSMCFCIIYIHENQKNQPYFYLEPQ